MSLRWRLPVLADEQGVVWLAGFGVAERCAITEHTEKVLVIQWKPTDAEGE